MTDSIEALIVGLRALANPPASAETLRRARSDFGELPEEVRLFYEHMDGTREMTPVEQAAIRFWPISEWKPVARETSPELYPQLASAPLVADHMIDSWWYALDCSPTSRTFGVVFLVDGARPAVSAAPSFTDFVRAVLSDDWSLYPRATSAP
ncbi:MAG TPA: SMI1/KNR4 family protein [Candidatus Paceibacterota bacterium]|nr:SMI1/KNR4 family protein [Candidatus Paceibacterota bacterium]